MVVESSHLVMPSPATIHSRLAVSHDARSRLVGALSDPVMPEETAVPLGAELLALEPGRPVELRGAMGMGMARLGYQLLSEPSQVAPVVVLDVKGWMSPEAAWEAGVRRDHLIFVRCDRPRIWSQVAAALCEGVRAIYAEVPREVPEGDLRRLAALVRVRKVRMALRPLGRPLPVGIAHLRLQATRISWEGADGGHGRLGVKRMTLEMSGRGVAGETRLMTVEDAGAGAVRVVSGVAAASPGRAVG